MSPFVLRPFAKSAVRTTVATQIGHGEEDFGAVGQDVAEGAVSKVACLCKKVGMTLTDTSASLAEL